MRASFAAAAIFVIGTFTACGGEAPTGPVHSTAALRVKPPKPPKGGNPHAVVRETTLSSYCLACHPLDPATNHPWGVSLADAAARSPGAYYNPPAYPVVVLVNGSTVECSSCHDDGTAGYPFLTVLDSFTLCTACHAY